MARNSFVAEVTFKKKCFFFFAINVKYLLNRRYTIQVYQKHYWEHFSNTDHEYRFCILKVIAFLADIGYLVKLLINH